MQQLHLTAEKSFKPTKQEQVSGFKEIVDNLRVFGCHTSILGIKWATSKADCRIIMERRMGGDRNE